MTIYFPKWFSGGDFNYLSNIIKLMTLRIDIELDGEDERLIREIEELNEYFLDFSKPKKFGRTENTVVEHELGFEEILSSMEEAGIGGGAVPVFEFYSRIKNFEKWNTALNNGNKQ